MKKPASPVKILKDRAQLLHARGQTGEAVMIWRNILLARPDDVDVLLAMGRALFEAGRIAEAEASLRVAVERAPQRPEIWIALSQCLQSWGSWQEAEDCLHNATARAPDRWEAHQALGALKLAQGSIMEAMAAFQAALDRNSDFAPARIGLGRGWWLRGQAEEAIRHFKEAAESAPKMPETQLQLGLALLSQGKGAEGWRALEGRMNAQTQLNDPPIQLDPKIKTLPLWNGQPLTHETLLVTHEGGLCEALQFSRLLNRIPAERVIYHCPASLKALLQGSHSKAEFVSDHETAPAADRRVPLLSLPHLLNLDRPDDQKPYLRADPTLLSPWRSRLEGGVKIGIAWKGGSRPFDAGERYVPLEAFRPLNELEGVSLVSLQKGDGRQEMDAVPFPVHDFDSEMDEEQDAFLDSAAMIQAMPLVIAVDGAIAHLAGALGRPVWCLLPPDLPEWRWQAEGRDTPWYPTMDLFRCPDSGNWENLMQELATRLRRMMAGEDPDTPALPLDLPENGK
ncbi:tetratricopeptide repeat protein [Aestuariispira insulae]|uniref:Tetratricopeptide repeat protein n=1 Tax=Aestuariispira insulae TaxID=1461337 RepID=A0A3D9H6H6_9PROT|nr:tetratricopeptide repeat protein [Aestuariispira insulae]RED45100.1 tetratricopeptide repeat protein [Aestuariispira insulae]